MFKFPVDKKLFKVFFLFSTHSPCSIIIGLILFFIKVNAAKSPLGPAPTITGLEENVFFIFIFGRVNSFTFCNFLYLLSFFTVISIE